LNRGIRLDRQLKAGIIGLGAMGKNHVRVYSELPEVEPAAVADGVLHFTHPTMLSKQR